MPPTLRTHIASSDTRSITIRGLDLVNDLIGHHSYTEVLYFLICGRLPSADEAKVLDACLVTLMEHGMTPSAIISRLISDSVPGQPQTAIAAGLLSIGDVFVGTMEGCARILHQGIERGGDLDAFCRDTVAGYRRDRRALPGFGHPIHAPDDPRPPRLFDVAGAARVRGNHISLLKRLGAELDRQAGRHITINATGAIGALLLEIDVPLEAIRAIAVISRAGGLAGHLVEERHDPMGRKIWSLVEQETMYEPPPVPRPGHGS